MSAIQTLPVWTIGQWLEPERAHVSTRDRGFLLGDSCFETLYYEAGSLEGIEEHCALLQRSKAALDFPDSINWADIQAALVQMQEKLATLENQEAAAVRVTISRGEGRGAINSGAPKCVIEASPATKRKELKPLRLGVSAIRRNETSPLSRLKAGCYGDNLAALREVSVQGFDHALMLNSAGRIAGLAMANILVVEGKDCFIVPESEGARRGYMLAHIIARLKTRGFQIIDAPIEFNLLERQGTHVFGVNSLWKSRPVTQVDGLKFEQLTLDLA